MPTGLATIVKQGCFDADVVNALNANAASTVGITTVINNAAFPFGSFGTAITLVPAAAANAGTYRVTIYGVVTTTITTATSWLFVLGYTDDKSALTPTVCTSASMTANSVEQGTYFFRSSGTAAITITPTAASAAAGAIAYTLILERIV